MKVYGPVGHKVGDKVICINSDHSGKELTKGNFYIIEKIYHLEGKEMCDVICDQGYVSDFFLNRFLTIKEYRKLKLKKLENERLCNEGW